MNGIDLRSAAWRQQQQQQQQQEQQQEVRVNGAAPAPRQLFYGIIADGIHCHPGRLLIDSLDKVGGLLIDSVDSLGKLPSSYEF
jgi:hypothetical protein